MLKVLLNLTKCGSRGKFGECGGERGEREGEHEEREGKRGEYRKRWNGWIYKWCCSIYWIIGRKLLIAKFQLIKLNGKINEKKK